MMKSEKYSQPCGLWHARPWWVFWRNERYRRSIFASAMIGGGWDGWEYSNDDHNI